MLQNVGENAKQLTTEYGNISAASDRRHSAVASRSSSNRAATSSSASRPSISTTSFRPIRRDDGFVNILVADKLMNSPKVYATFLMWMLTKLYEKLPEVGDPEKPKLVFFFDEAHLLFNDAQSALLAKIEQVVRLIRSKGVGVYFITQSPADVPDTVLAQLGNRVQHALRAFTPRDQKAVKTAAETFRPNPKLDTAKAITELAVGEALVSFLEESGTPQITWRAWMVPPCSQIGPITDAARDQIRKNGQSMYGRYEKAVDRESAYEKLTARTLAKGGAAPAQAGGDGSRAVATGPCARFDDDGSRGDAGRRAVRHDRPARRASRRPDQLRGEERGAVCGLRRRPRHPPRRAGIHPRRFDRRSRRSR